MHCPDCDHVLTPIPLGTHGEANQSYRCYRCGGFWLEAWLANRINSKLLDKWPQTGVSHGWAGNGSDSCPVHAFQKLERYIGDSVPRDMVVKKCHFCNWWWFPGNTLFSFKPAQEAKVNYYRTWGLPADLKGMLLPLVGIAVLIMGGTVAIKLVKQQQYAILDASGAVSEVALVYLGGGNAKISFKSVYPISKIEYHLKGDADWQSVSPQRQGNVYFLEVFSLAENQVYEFKILGKVYELRTN